MTKSQQNVKDFMLGIGQNCPDKPIIPDAETRILRVKLLLEEVFEFAEASGVDIRDVVHYDKVSLGDLFFRDNGRVDLVGVADGMADIQVINEGSAVTYGMDLEPFKEEVDRSNMSKIKFGRKREDGKWEKLPGWSAPDLRPILEKQINS